MFKITLTSLVLALLAACVAGQVCTPVDDSTKTVEGCDSDQISLTCGNGTVIQVVAARYGGRPGNTCKNKMNTPSPPCTVNNYTDVSNSTAATCNGKASCDLTVYPQGPPNNGDFMAPDQCVNNAKEAIVNYKCVDPCTDVAPRTLTGCDGETKTITCECGTVQIQSATWGGSSTAYCLNAFTTINPPCTDPSKTVDVSKLLQAKCMNTAECSFLVYDSGVNKGDLGATDPCPNQAKQVKVTYTCANARRK